MLPKFRLFRLLLISLCYLVLSPHAIAKEMLENSSFQRSDHFVQIHFNEAYLSVELAITPDERSRGLMERTHLSDGTGMLFVFEQPQILSFWMKNTKIPLSIAFFDADRRLINIEQMDPPDGQDLRFYRSARPALYAIEVPSGWFERHKIHPQETFEWGALSK